MNNFTTNTYEMKREILNFSKKIAKNLSKSEKKFIQDIEYGIAASGSCLISDISKVYGKKFEDLDDVIDASSQNKKVTKGYHVCEATILTEKEKQLISVYSQIYS